MGNFFAAIGTAIYNFITNPVVQAVLFVAQGVTAHQAAMKAKRTGADILLQKYGTGGGIPVIYGTRRVAGTVVYMETQNNRELYVVYAIAAHEIDSFDLESIQLDGRTIKDTNIYRQGYDISDGTTRINFRPSSVTRASGTFWGNTSTERANITGGANINNKARMTFNCHKGTTSQAADPMLEGILTDWTSNHKLTGIAYIAANYEYDTQGMFSGIPNLTIVVNGKKVFDPRDTGQTFGTESTYTHSSNAALCLLDYITNDDYGKGLGTSDLESDFASWKTAADDCDTSVDTIDHTGISVESASTDSDVMIIADASQTKFNKLKVGNKYTVDDGTTTYVNNKKLIDKDSTQIDIDGSNAFAILKLKFEDGAIDNAITSATSCDFAETQIRFDCNGVLDTEETVLENTKLLIANMRGIFTYANGKYQIKVEGAESSVVTLDEDDILESGITLSLENKEGKYNKVEAEFYNAQKRYESDTTYYTGETSDTFLADDGNEVLETRIQLPFCTNQRIAYNHAKGLLKRSRKQKTISFVATPKVLKAKVGEVITVSNTNLNLSSELYRITNMTINPDLNVAVTAIEYQTDVYGYVTPPDEDIDIPDDPPEGNRVVAPTNLTFTNKNATTGEAAKLTWTDSTKYPSYEFRVRIIDGLKTRYDKRVKDTYFYLDGISVKNGYEARVSAINALGVESDSTNITVNVTTEPITTPDIKQGSIGGFSFTDSKMYHPVDGSDTGVFETSNVYIDDTGQFSLKDKLSFDGTTLDISGNLTVENTITADKIVLDGINLDDLFAASGTAGNSTIDQSSKIFTFNWDRDVLGTITTYYGLRVDLTQLVPRVGIGVLTTPDDALHIKSGAPYVRLEDTGGYTRVKGVDTNIELEAGNTGSGYDNTSYILMDIAGNDVAKFHALGGMELPSLVPTTTTNRLYNNAGTLYWNGSAVGGGGSTTTINNNADNRIITGSNTADTLNGEANLTFDGSTLGVTGAISSGDITIASSTGAILNLTDSGSHTWKLTTDNQDNFFRVKDGTSTTYLKVGTADSEFSTNLNLTSGHNLTVGGYVSASNIINGLAYQISGTQVISSARNIENIASLAIDYAGTPNSSNLHVSGGKITIASTSNGYGQIQVGNTSTGEASVGYFSGVTESSIGGTGSSMATYQWATGLSVYGIGANTWGIGNKTNSDVFRLDVSGNLSIDGSLTTGGNININKETPILQVTDTSSSRNMLLFADDNNSVLRSSGQMLLQIGTSSAITIATNLNLTLGGALYSNNIFADAGTGINEFYCDHTTSSDDWAVSPISIRERGKVTNTQSANSYSPNINFHWGNVSSRSLTLLHNTDFVLGEWTASGAPETTGNLSRLNTRGYLINNTEVINSSRDLVNISTYGGTGLLTLTNTSNNHLRLAYNSTFYWNIYRESTTGDLIFDSSNTAGEFVRFDAIDKSITVSGNITSGGSFKSSLADSTPLGVSFANAFKADTGSSRVAYFDGNSGSTSVWWGVGNNAHGAIDSTDGYLDFWSNDSAGTWRNIFNINPAGLQVETGRVYASVSTGLQLGNFSTSNLDETGNSVVTFLRSGGWDDYIIKGSTNRGVFGRGFIGPHFNQSNSWGVFSSGWDTHFQISGDDRIYMKSKVGIGTANPSSPLTVAGSVDTGNVFLAGSDSGNYNEGIRLRNASNNHAVIAFGASGNSGTPTWSFLKMPDSSFQIRRSSTVMMSLANSTSDANMIVRGNITAYGSPSDIRLKENIATIENPLDKVAQLRGITFDYKKDGKRSTGLIAQELEKVLPEAVYETSDIDNKDDKFKAVRYGNVVGLLVEAIKEQQKQIDELKAKLK